MAEVERALDERDREDDRRLGEWDLDAERVELAPEQAGSAESGEERDPRHRGRQDQR